MMTDEIKEIHKNLLLKYADEITMLDDTPAFVDLKEMTDELFDVIKEMEEKIMNVLPDGYDSPDDLPAYIEDLCQSIDERDQEIQRLKEIGKAETK